MNLKEKYSCRLYSAFSRMNSSHIHMSLCPCKRRKKQKAHSGLLATCGLTSLPLWGQTSGPQVEAVLDFDTAARSGSCWCCRPRRIQQESSCCSGSHRPGRIQRTAGGQKSSKYFHAKCVTSNRHSTPFFNALNLIWNRNGFFSKWRKRVKDRSGFEHVTQEASFHFKSTDGNTTKTDEYCWAHVPQRRHPCVHKGRLQ